LKGALSLQAYRDVAHHGVEAACAGARVTIWNVGQLTLADAECAVVLMCHERHQLSAQYGLYVRAAMLMDGLAEDLPHRPTDNRGGILEPLRLGGVW